MFLIFFRLLFSVLICIFLPIYYLLLTPIYLYRYLIGKLVPRWNPAYGKILTAASTNTAVDDITTRPKWTLLPMLVVKGKLDFEELKRRCDKNVISQKNEKNELFKPELRQYVSQKFGFLFWKWDKEFRIENHFSQKVDEVEYKVLNREVLNEIMVKLTYKPFEPKRSPWEVIYLDNYQDEGYAEDGEPGKVIMMRFHHALGDGFSIMKLTLIDFLESKSLNVAISRNTTFQGRPPAKHIGQRVLQLLDPIRMLIRIPYDMAYTVVDIFQYNANSWHLPESQLTGTFNSAFTAAISVQDVKDVNNLCKCSFAAVVLAAYTGALRKFMMEAGYQKVPSNILAGVALPVPHHPDNKLRNHASAVLARLPTGTSGPLERLRLIEKNLLQLKKGTLAISMYYSSILNGLLFAWMVRSTTYNRNTTAIASIFPGPKQLDNPDEISMVDMMYSGGLSRGNVGLGFCCLSVYSKLNIGIVIDEGLVPKSKLPATKLADYMIQELEDLRKARNLELRGEDVPLVVKNNESVD